MVLEGAGFMLGGPTAGLLYDRSLTYNSSFCLAGLVLVLSALLVLVPWRYSRAPSPLPDPDREAAAEPASPVKVPAQPSDFLLPPEAGPTKPVLSQHGRPCDEAVRALDAERAPLCPSDCTCLQGGAERGQDEPAPHGERAPLCPPDSSRLQEGAEREQKEPLPDGKRTPLYPTDSSRLQEGTERGQEEPPTDGERAPLCPPENPRLQDVPVSDCGAMDTRTRPGRLRSPGAAARQEAATDCDPVPALSHYWNQPLV
ncbi:GAS2-like protein 2 [Pollicipes pollicipes]|uniref:GAS2-like protein 2 n=1 Tax=Pollicipes pollicipes TaxID=41117 RepID=UPI0018854689|nr:GAS2-like protein 2 [Pollicipes pollicipes]